MYWLAGCDEVGRGALAGPLVAAAVAVRQNQSRPLWLPAGRDSKMFTLLQREKLAVNIHESLFCSIGWVQAEEIDRLGLQYANHLAMKRAISNLPITPDHLLVDYVAGFNSELPFELIVQGDKKFWPIAAASIIAKCIVII